MNNVADLCFVVFDCRGVEFLPPYQLALQLAKLAPTIVVDGACGWRQFSRYPVARRLRTQAVAENHRAVLTRYTPLVFPLRFGMKRLTSSFNARGLRRELGALTRHYKHRVIIFDSTSQLPLVGSLGEDVSAYYLYDDFGVDLTGRVHDLRQRNTEPDIIRAVDVVLAVSKTLSSYAGEYASRVQYLPNGYNGDLFIPPSGSHRAVDRPPVIGLAGVISGRVDFVGLYKTAIERPDWRFRLVGQISSTLNAELQQTGRPIDILDRFLCLPNVEHLPPRPLKEVPPLMAEFDVGLIPYCLNRFTLASSPLKVYEYYAMGLPVVSTRVPEVVNFDETIHFVEEGQSYSKAIAAALETSSSHASRDRRLKLASDQTTLSRATEVYGVLTKLIGM